MYLVHICILKLKHLKHIFNWTSPCGRLPDISKSTHQEQKHLPCLICSSSCVPRLRALWSSPSAPARNLIINFDSALYLSAYNHQSLYPVNSVSSVILGPLLGAPVLTYWSLNACIQMTCQWLHADLQSHFIHFLKPLLRHSHPLFKVSLQYILLGSLSHLLLDSTLQVTFQNILGMVYLHSWL